MILSYDDIVAENGGYFENNSTCLLPFHWLFSKCNGAWQISDERLANNTLEIENKFKKFL